MAKPNRARFSRSRFITRDCAFRRAIALPETDDAKIGLTRTYVRQNYLKTTPNCRLKLEVCGGRDCGSGKPVHYSWGRGRGRVKHYEYLRPGIMRERPRAAARARRYKINGKLIARRGKIFPRATRVSGFSASCGDFRTALNCRSPVRVHTYPSPCCRRNVDRVYRVR